MKFQGDTEKEKWLDNRLKNYWASAWILKGNESNDNLTFPRLSKENMKYFKRKKSWTETVLDQFPVPYKFPFLFSLSFFWSNVKSDGKYL